MKHVLVIVVLFFSVNAFAQNKPLINDTIPLLINNQNTIYVKAIFNKTDTLTLNFDTGTTELILTNDVLKNKIKTAPKLYDTVYELQIGNNIYKTKIYPAELSGHGTDGRFGWDLFKGKIVELNYDKNALIIHSELPNYVLSDDAFTTLTIRYLNDNFSSN